VLVEEAAANFVGTEFRAPNSPCRAAGVTMAGRPACPVASRRVGPRQRAAHEFIGPLGGGDVEHARDEAALDQRFHRSPTGAGGAKTSTS